MSAMLAVIQSDRVHLLADGAFYDPETGVLTDIDVKVWPLPHINAAFSSRGLAAAFPVFAAACNEFEFSTFDEFTNLLPEIFKVFDTHMRGNTGEIVVVGWSQARNRGEVFARLTHDQAEGIDPGAILRWTAGRVNFGVELEDLPAADAFAPADALPAFERSRCTPMDLFCGEGGRQNMGYAVGGVLTHVEIRSDGTREASTLHIWPDEVGKKIQPDQTTVAPAGVDAAA